MSSLKSRVLVSVVGVPLLLWVVLGAPTIVVMVALCLLAGIGAVELQQCVSQEKKSGLIGLSGILAVFTVGWYYERPEYVGLLMMIYTVLLFAYAIVKGGEVKFAQTMASLFGSFAFADSSAPAKIIISSTKGHHINIYSSQIYANGELYDHSGAFAIEGENDMYIIVEESI